MSKFLVVDGYDARGIASLKTAGVTQAGILYKRMLANFIDPNQIDIVEISHDDAVHVDISKYTGVCWTGSNLFFSAANDIVQRHIDLCRRFFLAGTPQFGSCWAAQLAAITAGGEVAPNPKGREFGIARKIHLTEAGMQHPMFKGKSKVFDGFTSHNDIITKLPETSTLLAGNSFSTVQALEVKYGAGEFWALQYHPEYDCSEIAGLVTGRWQALVDQAKFQNKEAAFAYATDMRVLSEDCSRQDISWKYGIDQDLQNFEIRTREVQNWLSYFFDVNR